MKKKFYIVTVNQVPVFTGSRTAAERAAKAARRNWQRDLPRLPRPTIRII